jgi:hypothetical protein
MPNLSIDPTPRASEEILQHDVYSHTIDWCPDWICTLRNKRL